jgi:hypothetical protein
MPVYEFDNRKRENLIRTAGEKPGIHSLIF